MAVGHELCGNDQEALDVYLGLEDSTKVRVLAVHCRFLMIYETIFGP